MKISQYILLSFIGFLVSAVLVLYIDSVNAPSHLNGSVTIPKKHLGNFSVIVAQDEANITIKNNSINTIGATLFIVDSVPKLPEYKIINDTLFISKSAYRGKTDIHCKSVKTVVGQKKSHILFKDYKTDSLSVYANNSTVRGWLVNKQMQYINIEASNNTDMSVIVNQPINDCTLKIDSSRVRLHGQKSKVNNLNALLKNKANMHLKKVEKINLDCDSLSTYQIYNYN